MNHLFEIKFNFKITFIKPHPKKSNIIAIATDDSQLHVLDITNKENVSNMKILRENQLHPSVIRAGKANMFLSKLFI